MPRAAGTGCGSGRCGGNQQRAETEKEDEERRKEGKEIGNRMLRWSHVWMGGKEINKRGNKLKTGNKQDRKQGKDKSA